MKATELSHTKYIKILQAMLRSPKMCDLYQKASAARLSAEDHKKAEKYAVEVLRQNKFFDSNKNEYMESLVTNVQSIIDTR